MIDGKPLRVPIASLKRKPLRLDHGTEADLKALAQSWLDNPIHPILVRFSDMTIGDGHRRVAGLELLGRDEVEVFAMEGDISDEELALMGFISAFHRAPLGSYEQAMALIKMKGPGVANKGIADLVKVHPSTVTQLLSLGDCVEGVRAAAREGKLGVSDWYAISQAAAERQVGALNFRLGGATRDQLAEYVRNANGIHPAEALPPPNQGGGKQRNVTLPLPEGTVILKGKDLSIGSAIALLRKCLREAEAEWSSGMSINTFQDALRDRLVNGTHPRKKAPSRGRRGDAGAIEPT